MKARLRTTNCTFSYTYIWHTRLTYPCSLLSLPFRDIFYLLHDVIFDRKLYEDARIHHSNASAFRDILAGFRGFAAWNEDAYDPVLERTMSKYGLETISRRFGDLFRNEEFHAPDIIKSHGAILHHFSKCTELLHQLKADSVYSSAMHAAWAAMHVGAAGPELQNLPSWGLHIVNLWVPLDPDFRHLSNTP